MDPLSVSASIVALGGASSGVATALKSIYKDFRDAPRQMLHAQRQSAQVETNRARLNDLPQQLRDAIQPVNLSIGDTQAALPQKFNSHRKMDRFKWALSGRKRVSREISRLKEAESSTILALSVATHKEVEGVNPQLVDVQNSISSNYHKINSRLDIIERNQDEIEVGIQVLQTLACLSYHQAHDIGLNQQAATQIYPWNWLNGINLRVTVSRNAEKSGHKVYDLFLKCRLGLPLGWGKVFTGRIRILESYPSCSILFLTQQNIIHCDSDVIKLCKENDAAAIQGLFASGQAHPNDTTTDNLTLLHFAIRAGSLAVVKLLLDSGANPNLTFGRWETSPLNNAFLFGAADIIRILLRAGANLDYVNSRGWTSLSYLWEPALEYHPTTIEILDICFEQEFSDWNYKDTLGWSPIHRAAAFGRSQDIQSLTCRGASTDLYTTDKDWTPIHCAVLHGNSSTFETLVQEIHPCMLTQMKDSCGWGLLHLAAEHGSEEIMFQLIELGVDPDALTMSSSFGIPEGLEYKELRAETIAAHFGHREAYDNAMRAAAVLSVNIDEVEKPDK